MSVLPESIKSIRRDKAGTIVSLNGDIDLHRVNALHQELLELCKDKPARLVLDLNDVNYMDSSGVGTLVDVYRKVNAYNGVLALVQPNSRVQNLFQITKLDRFFKIFPSVEEALGA